MFRISYWLTVPEVEGTAEVAYFFSDSDDAVFALHQATEKVPSIVSALRVAMPMLSKVNAGNIETRVITYDPQLLLFELPKIRRSEVLPEQTGYQMFLHDSDPTLANNK